MDLRDLWLDLVYEVIIHFHMDNKQTGKQIYNQIEMNIVHLFCSSSGLSECGPQAQCSALLEELSCAKIILGYVYMESCTWSQLLPLFSPTGPLLWA